MEYYVVTAQYFRQLEFRVNERLRNGWRLVGGPFIGTTEECCQAVIKEDNSNTNNQA